MPVRAPWSSSPAAIYILTADHVWAHTAKWQQIGLGLAGEGTPLPLERDLIMEKRLKGKRYSRWGPDLALLEIPLHLVPTIRARKSFLNLARQRRFHRTASLRMTKAMWAVMGLVGEASSIAPRNPDSERVVANLFAAAFFGWTCKRTRRGPYDYLTTPAKTALPGVPPRFGGLSGGGLWQIVLTLKKATGVLEWRPRFCGVVFWEQPRSRGVVAVTAHGPKSVLDAAWKRWGLSEALRLAVKSQGARQATRRSGSR